MVGKGDRKTASLQGRVEVSEVGCSRRDFAMKERLRGHV